MSNYVQINNFFFEPTSFTPKLTIHGESRRTFSGKLHSDYSNKYHTFSLSFKQISPTELGHFLYLLNLVFPSSGVPEDLSFTDDVGNNYTVTIPIDGFNYDREQGEKETYSVELKLEEVI
ncbi:MAG: hypothetical protein ACOCZ5_02030 [bacterium]